MTSKKNVQFLHALFPFSVCVRIGPNWARDPPPPASGRPNLGYQPLSPSPLVFLQKIVMLKIKPKFCLKPTFLQNQTPACPGTLNGRTRHLSGTLIAERDTSLEHLKQIQTHVWNTVWTQITLILIIAVDIQFLWIPFPSPL